MFSIIKHRIMCSKSLTDEKEGLVKFLSEDVVNYITEKIEKCPKEFIIKNDRLVHQYRKQFDFKLDPKLVFRLEECVKERLFIYAKDCMFDLGICLSSDNDVILTKISISKRV